jgi:hypothetical protein
LASGLEMTFAGCSVLGGGLGGHLAQEDVDSQSGLSVVEGWVMAMPCPVGT